MSTATASVVTATGGAVSIEFHNVGALSSAWARPTECSTLPLAPSGISYPGNLFNVGEEVDNCSPYEERFPAECQLDGGKIDEMWQETIEDGSGGSFHLGYHSPGLQCPEAWETVGIVAMNNGTPSASGIFSPTAFTEAVGWTSSFPYQDFVANMFTTVLAPTETGVACCPSGYTADPWAGCYSHFPLSELASKTGCGRIYNGEELDRMTSMPLDMSRFTYTFDFYGTSATAIGISQSLPTDWNNPNAQNTSTYTFGRSGLPTDISNSSHNDVQFTGVAQVHYPVFLVQSGEEDEGNASETPDSAARALAPTTAWSAIGGVLAAWGIGMVAGVGLLAAW